MISTSAWALLFLAAGVQDVLGSDSSVSDAETRNQEPNGQKQQEQVQNLIDPAPLFLTPYIDNCSYYEARMKSITPFFLQLNMTAYSGYITVNKTTGSNIFFLLMEHKENSSSAPLLLWTQGGPGLSALFGLFLENGPLDFDLYPNGTPNIRPRINTLRNNMSVLYVDLPVGGWLQFHK
ncbi:hypothetical protein MRX96_038115 [Rhipicephalus microplus]